MVTELLESLSGQALPNQLIAGANVQEEVGLRGAHASTTKFNQTFSSLLIARPQVIFMATKENW